MGKEQTAKKRSAAGSSGHPSSAFSDLKRRLTDGRGFTSIKAPGGPVRSSHPQAPPPTPDSGFPLSAPAERQPAPARPQPAGRQGEAVLLTSFFTSVRSSSVRDSAVGSMAEAGGWRFFRVRELRRRAPPKLGAPASGGGARSGGGAGREEERCPFENRRARGSSRGASGLASRVTATQTDVSDAVLGTPLLPSPGGSGAGAFPRGGGAAGRARPPSSAAAN